MKASSALIGWRHRGRSQVQPWTTVWLDLVVAFTMRDRDRLGLSQRMTSLQRLLSQENSTTMITNYLLGLWSSTYRVNCVGIWVYDAWNQEFLVCHTHITQRLYFFRVRVPCLTLRDFSPVWLSSSQLKQTVLTSLFSFNLPVWSGLQFRSTC